MRFRIGILLLCVLATAARGQEGRPQHAQGKDVSFLVNAVPAFQFDTKLDGGSEFSVTRFLFQFDQYLLPQREDSGPRGPWGGAASPRISP